MSDTPRRRWWVLGIVGLLVLVNFPVAHAWWTRSQVESRGIEATAEVVEAATAGTGEDTSYLLRYRLPDRVSSGRTYLVEVTRSTYREARRTGRLPVLVLPEDPSSHVVLGAVQSSFGLWAALGADLVLLLVASLLGYGRRTGRAATRPLRLVALAEVTRCKPGSQVLERDGQFEVVGEVTGISEDEVVLTAGGRTVIVALDGHPLSVGYQQPAWVWARQA